MKLYTKLYTMRVDDPKFDGNKYQEIEAFTLPNGVKVFYDHVPDTPLVSIQAWVNTGSADESPKSAGISHMIEHMFFKGAANKKIAVIAKEIEALGGYINAFTSFEETVFYATIKNDYFNKALSVFAQTMIDPSFDEDELRMEREVVLDEIKRGKDDTYQALFLALYELAYGEHPYGRPIIGYEDTVRTFTRDTIFAHYRRWYAPSNINIVIAGDVPRQQMEHGVHAAFGDMRSDGAIKHIRPGQPEQRHQQSIVRRIDVKDTYYAVGFLTPPTTDDSSFALEVLAYLLGGNDTSRLPRIVKEENRLVDSIMVSHSANRYTGFFSISGTTAPEKLKKAVDGIMGTISDAAVRLPTHEEVERAKQMLKSMFIYDLETVKQRAMKIGEAVVEMGGLDYIMDYTKKIDSVDLEMIGNAIERYLRQDRLNVVGILPKKEASVSKGIVTSSAHPTLVSMDYALKHVGNVLMATFENGLRVIVKEKRTIPIVAFSAMFLGDIAEEPEDKTGLIHIMAMMLKKGTRYRKEADIERESDNISGMFSSVRTKQSFGMTGEFLNKYTDDGLNLFADMLLNPVFDGEEIKRAKRDVITDIRADKDNIGLQARNAFLRLLYGQSPLSLSEKGDESTVKKIERADVVGAYDKLVCSKNGVVSVVGDMDRMEIVKKIAWYLSAIRSGRGHTPAQQRVPPTVRREKTEKYKMKKNQAHILTGALTIPVNHRDRFAIMLLDQILGGQSGRLFVELRDRRGICYAVQTVGEAKLNNRGWFGIYTSTSPEKVDMSLGVIRSEIERLYRDGVNDIELENSKRYMLSDYDSRKQMALNVANILAYNELFEHSIDYYSRLPGLIMRVTRSEMNTVIRKYFSPDRFSTLVFMPR
ncbi:MAG: insulinase family protein [Deltaproteobacteria bacterium]|nr:insulinase family protein [Deltaproteobacteria bacterium]